MFETQKFGNKTCSLEIGLDIKTHASPKAEQDQAPRGTSAPAGTPHPQQMLHGNPTQLGTKSNSAKRPTPAKCPKLAQCPTNGPYGPTICHYIWPSSRMSRNTRERGTSHWLARSPHRLYNFLRDDFKRSLTHPRPRSPPESRTALRAK